MGEVDDLIIFFGGTYQTTFVKVIEYLCAAFWIEASRVASDDSLRSEAVLK